MDLTYKIEKRKLSLNLEVKFIEKTGINPPVKKITVKKNNGKQYLMFVDTYEDFFKFFLTKYIIFEVK